jgi:hypothetical protein
MLAALPARNYQRLSSGLEPVELQFGDVLYQAGQRIRYVYFPGNSLVSLLTVVDQRRVLEVGMVGREGMLGLPLALGALRECVDGAGLPDRRVQPLPRHRLAPCPLAADDARPGGLRGTAPDPRISGVPAGGAPRRHHPGRAPAAELES